MLYFRGRSSKTEIHKGTKWIKRHRKRVFITYNFVPGTELPTCGNERCSCVMCFINYDLGPESELPTHKSSKCSCIVCLSKYVPGGPKQGLKVAKVRHYTGVMAWEWIHSYQGPQVEWSRWSSSSHSPLICIFSQPDPLGNSREARDNYNVIYNRMGPIDYYGWYSRNTLLKWQYIVCYIGILVIITWIYAAIFTAVTPIILWNSKKNKVHFCQ